MSPEDVLTDEPHVPKAYRFLGKLMQLSRRSAAQIDKEMSLEDPVRRLDFLRYHSFAEEFVRNGAPTFVLSHSIAAALTATKAPKFSFARCPFSAFLVEVPSEFLPLAGGTWTDGTTSETIVVTPRPKRWISVLVTNALRAIAIHVKGAADYAHFHVLDPDAENFDEFYDEANLKKFVSTEIKTSTDLFEMQLAIRIASNTTAFVTTHRESVKQRVGTPSDVRLLDVECPREVCVDRAFRDQVIALVGARTIPRARGVLAHLVRGHWRSSGDDLIWIAPYRRGDENIGKIVERVEHL